MKSLVFVLFASILLMQCKSYSEEDARELTEKFLAEWKFDLNDLSDIYPSITYGLVNSISEGHIEHIEKVDSGYKVFFNYEVEERSYKGIIWCGKDSDNEFVILNSRGLHYDFHFWPAGIRLREWAEANDCIYKEMNDKELERIVWQPIEQSLLEADIQYNNTELKNLNVFVIMDDSDFKIVNRSFNSFQPYEYTLVLSVKYIDSLTNKVDEYTTDLGVDAHFFQLRGQTDQQYYPLLQAMESTYLNNISNAVARDLNFVIDYKGKLKIYDLEFIYTGTPITELLSAISNDDLSERPCGYTSRY